MITKVVNVDLHQPIYEKLTAKQGDIASRFILFHLLDGDTPFDLTGRSVRVYARKPDKTEIFNDLIINDETKGYCTLELTSQCLAKAGIVKMELYISESDKVLTSIPFELEVINSINDADSIVSTNEFNALTNMLASLMEYDNYKKVIDESGLARLKATSKFTTTMGSYIGLVNTAYQGDSATRFYLLPKAPVTSGVGGCLKIFADNYPEHVDYRDLGIYFHADQNGDKGYYGNGVNWFNVKVLDGSKYDNKYPDMGFSFQDGKVVAGRITCFNGSKPMWVFGGAKPTSQAQGKFYIAEYQDNVAFLNEKGINFLNNDKTIGCIIRVDGSGDTIFSNSQSEIHAIDGVTVMTLDDEKTQFEKSTHHNSNIVFNNSSDGVILKSPNGTQYKIKVSDNGVLSTERI